MRAPDVHEDMAWAWRETPLVTTSVDFQDSLAEETEAGANMSVYWPLKIFAAFKAMKHVCERFREIGDATMLREYCFDEGELNELLPCGRFNDGMERYRVLDQFRRGGR